MTVLEIKEASDVVVIDFSDLKKSPSEFNLSKAIEKAFGKSKGCLGLLLVKNIPEFSQCRENMLKSSINFAKLPAATKEECTQSQYGYVVGWSHGKERMNGQLDFFKGSYYGNPIYDVPFTPEEIERDPVLQQFPIYTLPNVWPETALPDFSCNFKTLGKMIFDTSCLLAAHCDAYIEKKMPNSTLSVQKAIANSRTVKGRLLHYFPSAATTTQSLDSWCGWHLDHSILTGLTSAWYSYDSSPDGPELDPASTKSLEPIFAETGLYIQSRDGETFRVTIPKDHLAFQIGECLQLMSGGFLQATNHCVRGVSGGHGIARDTLAVFMQPNLTDIVDEATNLNFAKFSQDAFKSHY